MERITINPNIRFGKPCIQGTRVAVADILNLLATGYTIDQIPEQYPDITRADVVAALAFAGGLSEEPVRVMTHLFAHP